MVEAFVEGVRGTVTVVVRNESSFVGLRELGDVEVVALPELLYGRFPANLKAARTLMKITERATSLSVVGADIMDGAYDWQSAVTRSDTARRAARTGLSTRVIGFSWNSRPHPKALRAVTRAGASGVRLLARDSRSEQRLRESHIQNVTSVTDIVFTSSALTDDIDALGRLGTTDKPVVLLNASGLVGRSTDQTAAYARLVENLVEWGYDVGLLPHVIRTGGDDLAACRAVFDSLPQNIAESATLIERLLRPREVRTLAARAAFVVTGRMHLAVIALSQGVPSAVVSTQGKVDGLMEAFGIPDLVVQPDAIPSGALENAGATLHQSLAERRDVIAARLPEVKRKAAINFDGLR
ncbi:hypothetical protein F6B41_00235 [Microbacterium lushaniae]|nr:hypothetical protein F6B41_00700 [Microbacterium lushaniae]KAA9159870.1 hypothetical protein F6B41_00235 [Microbacterium lushaniae]